MELVNLMYQYVNHLINSDELIDLLKKIDLDQYSSFEKEETQKLIIDIEKIKLSAVNELDDEERKKRKQEEQFLAFFEQLQQSNIDDEAKKIVEKQYEQFLIDHKKIHDGGELYQHIFELLMKNEFLSSYIDNMDDLTKLDFIVQYQCVSVPLSLDKKQFQRLVKLAIKDDKREALWRLAIQYSGKEMDFSLIVHYFIQKRDDYYLTELIRAVEEDLDKDGLLKEIVDTHDKKFITKVVETGYQMGIFSGDEVKEITYG